MADRESKRRKLAKALAITSRNKLKQLRNLLDVKEDATPSSSHGYGWRTSREVLEKAMSCYQKVSLPSTESDQIHFYIGKIEALLQYMFCDNNCYKESFDTAFSSHDTLELLLYADETTGGKVLATASSKQFYFFHVAIKQIGHLRQEEAWLPFAAIPVRDLKLIRGQLSAVMALICRSIDQQDKNGVRIGDKTFRAKIFAMIGDYDAIAKTFAAKGAAGLKPCCLCQNILMKSSDVPMADDYFQNIACPSVSAFQQYKHEELIGCYEKLLTDTRASTKNSKTRLKPLLVFRFWMMAC